MATIRLRKNDLFHAGLVSLSEELYVIIVEETKKILGSKPSKITGRYLSSLITEFCSAHRHDSIVAIKNIQLNLFVADICWERVDIAVAEVTLSLPLLATVKDQSGIWTMIRERIGLPGYVDNGELCLSVKLEGKNCPIETKKENGKKVFIARPKFTQEIEAAA